MTTATTFNSSASDAGVSRSLWTTAASAAAVAALWASPAAFADHRVPRSDVQHSPRPIYETHSHRIRCLGGSQTGRGAFAAAAGEAPFVVTAVSDLTSTAKARLGKHGASRLAEFILYPDGWAGGEGRALLRESLAAMDTLLSIIERFPTEPSVFLTRDGILQLTWDSPRHGAIELDLLPEEIAYYVSEGETEGSVPLTREGLRTLRELVA